MLSATDILEQKYGVSLKHATGDEWYGQCPFCVAGSLTGDDRFRVWVGAGKEGLGSYWCRQCGTQGWIDQLLDDAPALSSDEIRFRRIEAEQRQIRAKLAEHERRLTALERMNRSRDHLTYHAALDDNARRYWHTQGMNDTTIDRYLLGYCECCPTDTESRPSWTIPVINGGKLVNIRHRLIGADNGDKYRPHMAGLGNTLYLADHVYAKQPDVMVVEGEKKALVCDQHGFLSVGIMGKSGFHPSWAKRFEHFERVYVALDPDARERAYQVAGLFGKDGRVVECPVKVDDLFAIYQGQPADLHEFLRLARRVH